MARITVEDCLRRVPNRFILAIMAAARTKQLLKGSKPRVQANNKEIVLALREIAAGKVTPVLDKGQIKSGEKDNGKILKA